MAAEPWVSVDQVALYLGVTKDSVYRWLENRGLPAQKVGELWKLRISEIDKSMTSRSSAIRSATFLATAARRPNATI